MQENYDPNVGVEFAKQVALTLNRNEPSSKPVEDTRIIDPQVLCPTDVGSIGVGESDPSEIVDVEDPGNLADTESICDFDNNSASCTKKPYVILYNKKDNDPISINESATYDNEISTSQIADTFVPAPPELRDITMYDVVVPQPDSEDLAETDSVPIIEAISVPETTVESVVIPESVESIEPESIIAPLEVAQPVTAPTSLIIEESMVPDSGTESSEVTASAQKIPDKASSLDSKLFLTFILIVMLD